MVRLQEIEVLAGLPRVELAKLMAEMEEVVLQEGQALEITDSLFILSSGCLELQSVDCQCGPMCITKVGPGEMVGEWLLLGQCGDPPMVVAVSESILYRISVERWQGLLARHSAVNRTFQTVLLQRLQSIQQSLIRYKRYLQTYATELWPDNGDMANSVAAAQIAEPVAPDPLPACVDGPPRPGDSVRKPTSWKLILAWSFSGLCLLLALVSWRFQSFHGATAITVTLIFIWTTINWLFHLIPDYVVALGACLMTVMLGLASSGEIFKGFADPTWFLLMGAFALGAVVQKSGILFRLVLHLLRILPPTYIGQSFALAVTGVLLTPCMPSVTGRAAIAGPLALELGEAMRFPSRSKGSAGLAMAAFLGFAQMKFLFLNGSGSSLLIWGLVPLTYRESASWAHWFWAAFPLGFVIFALTLGSTIFWLFREEGASVSKVMVERQLAVLGKMSQRERLVMWVSLAIVAGFVLEPFHHMNSSWLALAGFLAMAVFGLLDKEMVRSGIDWQYMLFYGAVTGMVTLVDKSGMGQWLQRFIAGPLSPWIPNVYVLLLGVGLITILLRLLLQPATTIILMTVAFLPLAISMGHHPLVISVIVVAGTSTWIVPQSLPSYTTLYSTTQGLCYDHRQVRPLAIVHSLAILIGILLSVPYWQAIGLLSFR